MSVIRCRCTERQCDRYQVLQNVFPVCKKITCKDFYLRLQIEIIIQGTDHGIGSFRQIPSRMSYPTSCNFIIRMLFLFINVIDCIFISCIGLFFYTGIVGPDLRLSNCCCHLGCRIERPPRPPRLHSLALPVSNQNRYRRR